MQYRTAAVAGIQTHMPVDNILHLQAPCVINSKEHNLLFFFTWKSSKTNSDNIIYCQALKGHFQLLGHVTMAKQSNLSSQMDKINSFELSLWY